jgi:thymidylate kinase
MRAEQNRINATATDEEHYRYFTQVIKAASVDLMVLREVSNIVVDRYWITTVVYHRAMKVSAKLVDMGEIVMPDATVYLTVSPEAQTKRMNGRGMSPGDKRMDGRQHLLRQIYDEVLATEANIIRVDTDLITPEQAVDLIVTTLNSL